MKIKLNELNTVTLIILITLIVFGIIFMLITNRRKKWSTSELAYASLSLALSFILSYIRLFKLPQGGSVTPASMLPLMAFSYVFGTIPGLVACFAYGLIQFIQNPTFISLLQVLLDYPLAFGSLALCGTVVHLPPKKNSIASWLIGIALASSVRFVCHVISGTVFFAEYASGSGYTPLIYSVVYNSFVFVDAAVCAIIICIPQIRKVFAQIRKS